MGNDALDINRPSADITINNKSSDWLWAVFAFMLLIDLIIIGWTFTIPKGRRTFHHMAVWILTTSAIAYFLMASGLGETAIRTEFRGGGRTRSIWYVRYIMWFITTPLLLLELLFITALPLSDVASTIFFGLVFVVAALIGALIASSYKWGMFAFSVASGLYVVFMLLGPGRQSAGVLGIDYKKTFLISAAYLSFLSMLYPICWGLSDGGNRISPTSEMVFYGILDLLTKPVFLLFHLWQISRLDYTAMQLQSGKYSEGATLVGGRNDAELGNLNTKNRLADANAAHTTASAQPRHSEAATLAPAPTH